jgi:protein ImuB
MRAWIAVHLPLLSLEAIRPRWSEPGKHVLIDREHASVCSAEAVDAGVRSGMRRSGVLAICPDAHLHLHDAAADRAALDSIALSLLQYTPELAFAEEASLLLDVTASLRAFGGRRALCRLIRANVLALGFTPRIGMAPTAQGAWLLANYPPERCLTRRRVVGMESLMHCLNRLPCTLLPCARPFQEWLDGIGCRSLGELRRLPRAGLQRRCSQALLNALDRAYGEDAELFDWVQAPAEFDAKLELPERVEYAEAVLFAARRLILQMTGWLVARQLAASRFVLAMEHERGRQAIPPTLLEIVLAEAAWQEPHLVRLLKERLARLQLVAPVIALRLQATRTERMAAPSESLFPEPGGTPADFKRLLELLTARLGEHAVQVPAPHADYRPDVCNQWQPATRDKRLRPTSPSTMERPFWLLDTPIELMMRDHRPFYGSPLRLVSPPERIECGWWDDRLLVRDYFVAQGTDSTCYWIYRERGGEQVHWFLHGLFG